MKRHIHPNRLVTYLDEAIYGANDGIVTTFAVVSGAAGASLGHDAIIIMGLANLVADGFSMGASSFLSIRTEADVARAHGRHVTADEHRAGKRSLVTFGAFVASGCLPLAPFLFVSVQPGSEFFISTLSAALAFFVIGGVRSYVTARGFLTSGLEMLVVGGMAAALAFGVGFFIKAMVV